jgi:hypothetical protein
MSTWKLVDANLAKGATPKGTLKYNEMLTNEELVGWEPTGPQRQALDELAFEQWGDFYSPSVPSYWADPSDKKLMLAKMNLVPEDSGQDVIAVWYRLHTGLSDMARIGLFLGGLAVLGGIVLVVKNK